METSDSQFEVSRLLRRGVLFSILWLFGVGSLIAFVSALRARRLIRESNGTIEGMARVWWCLIVGGIGMAFWFPILAVGIFNNL